MTNISEIVNNNSKLYGLYIAKVVNDEDPKKRNRVQIFIPGLNHDSDSKDHYIWARVANGLVFGGKGSKDGFHTTPYKDSFVYVQFLQGNPNEPIVIGGVRADNDGSKEYRGELKDFNKIRNDSKLEKEVDAKVGKYPKITAIEGVNYSFILDDTPDYPQIKMMLKNGNYWELRPDLIQMKTNTDLKTYVGNDYFLLVGNSIEEKMKSKTITASQDIIVNARKITFNVSNFVVNSPTSKFSGDVSIDGALGVKKAITSMVNVFISTLGLKDHTHKSNKTGKMSGLPTNNPPGI